MLGHCAIDGFLHGFAQETLAKLLFQKRHRDFALAEALHLDFRLSFNELFVHLGVEIGSRHGDGIGALEAFVEGFGDLHVGFPLS